MAQALMVSVYRSANSDPGRNVVPIVSVKRHIESAHARVLRVQISGANVVSAINLGILDLLTDRLSYGEVLCRWRVGHAAARKLNILVMIVIHLGFAALAACSIYVAGYAQHDVIVLRITSGESNHFMSDISTFHSFNGIAPNVSFNPASRTVTASRFVGTIKFKTKHRGGNIQVITLDSAYNVPNRQHNIVLFCQLTHSVANAWEPPNSKARTWQDVVDVMYPFTYARNEFI